MLDVGVGVLVSGLEDSDSFASIEEPAGDDVAGRASADDDVIQILVLLAAHGGSFDYVGSTAPTNGGGD